MEIWDVWSTDGGSQGLSFALGKMEHAETVLVHSPPTSMRVEVRSEDGKQLAFADGLKREGKRYPMCRLHRAGGKISRADGWPVPADIGRPVLLPGGEIGILKSWWNAPDGSEWRWTAEFYNRQG